MLLTTGQEWYIQPENNNPANGHIGPWKQGFSGRFSSEVEVLQSQRTVVNSFATEKRVYLFGARDRTIDSSHKNARSSVVSAPINNGIIGDFVYENEMSQKLKKDDDGVGTIRGRRPYTGYPGTLYVVNDWLYNTKAKYPYTIDADAGTIQADDFAGTVDADTRYFNCPNSVFIANNRVYYSKYRLGSIQYADILVNGRVGTWNTHPDDPTGSYNNGNLIPVRNSLGGDDRVYLFPWYASQPGAGEVQYVEISRTSGEISEPKLHTIFQVPYRVESVCCVATGKFIHCFYTTGFIEDVDTYYLNLTGSIRRSSGVAYEDYSIFTKVNGYYVLHTGIAVASVPIMDDASLGSAIVRRDLFVVPGLYGQHGLKSGGDANTIIDRLILQPVITSNRIYLFYAVNIDDKDNVIVGYFWAPFNSTQLVSRYDIPRGNVRGAIHADSVTPQPVTKKGLGLFRMPTTFTVRGGLSVRQSPQPARVRASGMFNPPRLTVRGGLSVRQSPLPVVHRAAGMFNPPRLTVRGRITARRSLRLGGRYTLRARLGIRGVCVVDDDWILRFKREEVL